MHPPRRSLPRRSLCAVLLLSQLIACMTWRPARGALDRQAGSEPIRNARLTLRNGTQISLHDVSVRSDSVIGFAGDARERRAFPTPDVVSIAQRELSVGRSSILVVGAVVIAFLVVLGAALGQLGNNIGATPAPSVP
jgi:hypothetical protein